MTKIKTSRAKLLEELGVAGRTSSTATVLLHMAISERLGLGAADAKAYDVLLREGPLTAGQIGARTGLTSGSVTALIDRLEGKGFVRRQHDHLDRRRIFIHANPEKMAEAHQALSGFLEGLARLHSCYNRDELRLLLVYQQKVAALSQETLNSL